MTRYHQLQTILEKTFEDRKVDSSEKAELFREFSPLTREQRAFTRNKAFDMVKIAAREESAAPLLKWLEAIVKSLDNSEPLNSQCEVHFSPGAECASALINLIRSAKRTLDICVFTISDNNISDEIIAANKRGVKIRIITDNDKTLDQGSDIDMLAEAGVPVRIDQTRHHMHHKFAVRDNKQLATGSFNWTRSASKYNHENLVIMDDQETVRRFGYEFERLWESFA